MMALCYVLLSRASEEPCELGISDDQQSFCENSVAATVDWLNRGHEVPGAVSGKSWWVQSATVKYLHGVATPSGGYFHSIIRKIMRSFLNSVLMLFQSLFIRHSQEYIQSSIAVSFNWSQMLKLLSPSHHLEMPAALDLHGLLIWYLWH